MTKVTVQDGGEAGAVAPVAAAPKNSAEFTDHKGRRVRIRRLDPRDNMRLAKLVGPECVKNEEYMIYARAAYVISAIDGEPEGPLMSIAELEHMADRLGEDGIVKVIQTYAENFAPSETDAAAVKN